MSGHIVKTSKTIRVQESNVLAILHDPVKLSRLNPLVIDVIQNPTDPTSYTIVDKMVILGIFAFTTQYVAKFTMTTHGVDVNVQASSGVKMTNQWRVQAAEDESCEVTETVLALQANPLVIPLVTYILRKSHIKLLEKMKTQLEDHEKTSSVVINDPSESWGLQMLTVTCVLIALFSLLFNGVISFGKACVVFACFLPIISLALRKIRVSDPYGTYHLPLNIPPGANQNTRPDTEWLNMGYWKETRNFSQACEALALRLADAATCVPGGHVLDVGHACGDSLLLQLSHPNIPRPASLTGITSLYSHHTRSLERIAARQSVNSEGCKVTLFCGDAVFRFGDNNHPLDPSSPTPQFSTILALDCAYHFASREMFLRQSFDRLSPGGNIALADLAVSSPLSLSLRMVLSTMLSVRPENIITLQTYKEQLRMIGYINIHIADISNDVFPGFRTFLKSRGGLWGLFEIVIGWWVKAGGKFLIVSASKPVIFARSE